MTKLSQEIEVLAETTGWGLEASKQVIKDAKKLFPDFTFDSWMDMQPWSHRQELTASTKILGNSFKIGNYLIKTTNGYIARISGKIDRKSRILEGDLLAVWEVLPETNYLSMKSFMHCSE